MWNPQFYHYCWTEQTHSQLAVSCRMRDATEDITHDMFTSVYPARYVAGDVLKSMSMWETCSRQVEVLEYFFIPELSLCCIAFLLTTILHFYVILGKRFSSYRSLWEQFWWHQLTKHEAHVDASVDTTGDIVFQIAVMCNIVSSRMAFMGTLTSSAYMSMWII